MSSPTLPHHILYITRVLLANQSFSFQMNSSAAKFQILLPKLLRASSLLLEVSLSVAMVIYYLRTPLSARYILQQAWRIGRRESREWVGELSPGPTMETLQRRRRMRCSAVFTLNRVFWFLLPPRSERFLKLCAFAWGHKVIEDNAKEQHLGDEAPDKRWKTVLAVGAGS